ncbi:MAG: hypothetical protein INR62_10795, partial [Rhodospirillales bacterium]|nr:hypothetical protein [Acetobacter sp.]
DMPTIDPRSGGVGKLDTWAKEQESANAEIPDVDFGRTLQYKPSSRPGTSGTLMPGDDSDKRRSKSADALRSRSKDRLSGAFTTPKPSPGETNRNSYFGGGRNTPSPGRGLTPDPAGRLTPDVVGRLSPSNSSGAANAGRRSVTPEEWVAQRASLAQQTQYAPPRKPVPNLAHMRSESTNSVKQRKRLTKTPPLGRTLSGDWTNFGGRETPPPRPSSRGAGVNLDLANASLTAREQMQVSRATGTPLVDLAKNKKVTPKEEDFGLVGAVAARERDKASSRSNRNSMAVQQAIVERQQMQMRADAEAAAQAQQHAQYQAQVQAAHQQQMALMQQQQERMYYVQNQGAHYQNQQQGYQQYGQQQQRPGLQTQGSQSEQRASWYGAPQPMQQGSFQQAAQGYYAQSPAAYSPGGGQGQVYGQGQGQGQGSGYPQQAYGASFFAQQAAQQANQGQGQGGQGNQRRSSWRTWR